MQLDWYESRKFNWVLEIDDGYMLARLQHLPTGWKLHWRVNAKQRTPWQSKDWPCTELEEAKAWAIAMIRMSQ
jgi:hypothetical protein